MRGSSVVVPFLLLLCYVFAGPTRQTFSAGSISQSIIANQTITSQLTVTGVTATSNTRIYVGLFLPHNAVEDLVITLESPGHINQVLVPFGTGTGNSANILIGTLFDDLALDSEAEYFYFSQPIPTIKPNSILYDFLQGTLNGVWTLTIFDNSTDFNPLTIDEGVLLSFQIIFETNDLCQTSQCGSGATCTNYLNSISCHCNTGFGPTCGISSTPILFDSFENGLSSWVTSGNPTIVAGYDFTPHTGFHQVTMDGGDSITFSASSASGTGTFGFWMATALPQNPESGYYEYPYDSSLTVTSTTGLNNPLDLNSATLSRIYPNWVFQTMTVSFPCEITITATAAVNIDDVILVEGTLDSCDVLNCNSGTCTSGACVCPSSFNGTECQIPINPCTTENLCPGGTCDSNGTCTCGSNNFGNLCAFTSQCSSCGTGVSCVNYYCNDECLFTNCGAGVCESPSGTCNCTGTGYEVDQSEPLSNCDQDTCGLTVDCPTNAVCHAGKCTCNSGWTGSNCDVSICTTCQNGGSCTMGSSTCDCTGTHFHGTTCSDPDDPCSTITCLNGGVCVSENDTATCNCTGTNYNGTYCDVSIICPNGYPGSQGCSCYSGFTGIDCDTNSVGNCTLNTVDQLKTEIVAEFQASKSSISNNSFIFVIDSPARYHRYFNSISLNNQAACSYPNSNGLIAKTFDPVNCVDVYTGNFSFPILANDCGFNIETNTDFLVFSGSISVTAIDYLGTFLTLSLQRTTSSSLSLKLSIPININVTTTPIEMITAVSLLAAVTYQDFNPDTGIVTLKVTTSLLWAYSTVSVNVTLSPASGATVNASITNSTLCGSGNFSTCTQETTVWISGISSPVCNVDGLYGLSWQIGCRGGYNCSDPPSTANFTVTAGDLCSSIEIDSHISGDIVAFSDSAFSNSALVFMGNTTVYFKAAVVADVQISDVVIENLYFTINSQTTTVVWNQTAVLPSADFQVLSSPTGNEGRFSLYLASGDDSSYLIDLATVGEGVLTFQVTAQLSVSYRTTFGKKRDLMHEKMAVSLEAVLRTPERFTPVSLGLVKPKASAASQLSFSLAFFFIIPLLLKFSF